MPSLLFPILFFFSFFAPLSPINNCSNNITITHFVNKIQRLLSEISSSDYVKKSPYWRTECSMILDGGLDLTALSECPRHWAVALSVG